LSPDTASTSEPLVPSVADQEMPSLQESNCHTPDAEVANDNANADALVQGEPSEHVPLPENTDIRMLAADDQALTSSLQPIPDALGV